MRFDSNLMDAVSFGKAAMCCDESGYSFCRYTPAQREVWRKNNPLFSEPFFDGYFSRNCDADANVRIDFTTDSASVTVDVSEIEPVNGSTLLETEVFANGRKALTIAKPGRYTVPLGRGGRFQMIFPYSAHLHIRSVETVNGCAVVPAKHRLRWLAHGDSITQGAGATLPSRSYVARIAARYGAELLNQANSGYVNDPDVISAIPGWEPDIVTSAYGTNDVGRKDLDMYRRDLFAVCDKLKREFPHSKIYVLSPVWSAPLYEDSRFNFKTDDVYRIFAELRQMPGITLIDGLKLIPNSRRYYLEDGTHPNDRGHTYYAARLGKLLFPDGSDDAGRRAPCDA